MPKRLSGKQKERLAKKAKVNQAVDERLAALSWSLLDDRDQDENVSKNDNQTDEEEFSEGEVDYESMPRKFADDEENMVERLPVIQLDGSLRRVLKNKTTKSTSTKDKDHQSSDSEDDSESDSESDSDLNSDSDEAQQEAAIPEAVRIVTIQETIADCAEKLNEDAEENIGRLKVLRDLLSKTRFVKGKRIILLSMVPIFKNLIPGYRIRPLTDEEKKQKVSKEVAQLRNFEEGLLANYKAYIAVLSDYSKKCSEESSAEEKLIYQLAISCACELLEAAPYFNFRNDLITLLVRRLSKKRGVSLAKSFDKTVTTIAKIFDNDYEGHVSFDIVRLISKMIKSRHYKGVEPEVLDCFLHLKLLTELQGQADLEKVNLDKEQEIKKARHVKKKDRVHLSKKERKARKENLEIDLEYMRAEAAVSTEERERLQGETLKLVFILYFNILKERSPTLMGPTLEGLAKFAHLVNADLFGDLLEVLRELVIERQKTAVIDDKGLVTSNYEFKPSATREALLCVVTAFALLHGQNTYKKKEFESMNLDLGFFVSHLYSAFYALSLNADIEYSHKTLRLDDPLKSTSANAKAKVNVATEIEMVIRAMEGIFFQQRQTSKLRVEAFTKRLAIALLQLPEKSCIASLKLLDRLNRKYTNTLSGLYSTQDRVANGVFNPEADEPEQSNPDAATIWETVLLEKHYSPYIAKAARNIPKGLKEH